MKMDYERELLERLLGKYEKSKAYITGHSSRRIALTASEENWLQSGMENPEEKKVFFATLEELKQQRIIDYSWVKFEKGNLVDKIWLIQDENRIREGYRLIGRTPAKEKAAELLALIEEYAGKLAAGTQLLPFLKTCMYDIQNRKKCSSCFTEDKTLNEDILKCLVYMENNENEQMERIMSLTLYGDSKRFERDIKSKVLSILKAVKRRSGEDIPEDDELLREKGIVRWPEIMEFTGNLRVHLEDGGNIDYAAGKYGAYINSETVAHISEVKGDGIHRVLFIENKANYVWYISHERTEEELVIFHGGCYSPVKGNWFRKIREGLERQPKKPEYYHWGDIDAGGFRIFQRLRGNIIPELKPYRMDVHSLEQYRGDAVEITSPVYLRTLEKMSEDPDYACFHRLIIKMLEDKIRLEQEAMILA